MCVCDSQTVNFIVGIVSLLYTFLYNVLLPSNSNGMKKRHARAVKPEEKNSIEYWSQTWMYVQVSVCAVPATAIVCVCG